MGVGEPATAGTVAEVGDAVAVAHAVVEVEATGGAGEASLFG